jgi:hypothetical protein
MARSLRVQHLVAASALSTLCLLPAIPPSGHLGAALAQQQAPLATPLTPAPRDAYRPYAPGLLARTVYLAGKAGRVEVELWDLLVGPGKKTGLVSLPGAAVLDVRSGGGAVAVGGKTVELRMGATLAIDEGQGFTLENRVPDGALTIRAIVVRRAQP